MRIPETPEGWQKPRVKAVAPPLSAPARLFGYALATVFLVAGVAAYVLVGRDTSLAGSLPLPRALQTKSPAHDDLLLLGRALNEIETEAEEKLGFRGAASSSMAVRLRARVRTIHDAGRLLEPRLTRDETRILMAFEQAERIIGDYIEACADGAGDDAELQVAKRQLATGLALGRGEKVEDAIVVGIVHKAKHSQVLQDLNDVRHVKLRLIDE